MNNTELRIGNIFEYDNEWFTVAGLSLKNGGHRIDFTETAQCKLVKNCNSINLDDKWLLELGFYAKEDRYHHEYYMFLDFWYISKKVKFDSVLYKLIINDNYIVHVKYVHQLQNLFFALTGTELELKTKTSA